MGLSFLAPLFLAGLVAVAVPLLVHLAHREREDAVDFPSLMFLQRIDVHVERRRRLRDRALLALRVLAIVLLAAAFARPFLDRPGDAAVAAGEAREVVVLLDRSYSMGYGDRWQRAVDAARSALDGLRPSDRATIVLFDETAAAATAATADRPTLMAALDTVRPGPRTTRYGPALKLAESVLRESDRPRREAVLVSDFQRAGWQGAEGVRLPPGSSLRTVVVGDSASPNRTVTSLALAHERVGGGERVTATARVANAADAPARDLAVSLELDGRVVQERTVDVPARDAATVAFAPFVVPAGGVRGAVRTAADALAADDTFRFVVAPRRPVRVVVVEGPRARGDASLYLRRALAIGDQPRFAVTRSRAGRVRPAELDAADVVVLVDAPFPAGADAAALEAFVRRGGGVLVVAGESGTLPDASWIPGRFAAPVTAGDGGLRLGTLDRDHPALETFAAPRSGDFSTARFFRLRPLMVAVGDTATRVLARFDDGAAALAERDVDAGRVAAWASSLDAFWNDLALQPVFLPLVHGLARHLAGWSPEPEWRTVGEALAGLRLEAPGFYDAPTAGTTEPAESAGTAAPAAATVAVNVDLRESELAPLDPRELAGAVMPAGAGTASGAASAAAGPTLGAMATTPEQRERSQALWWRLVLAAFALLAVETVLANWLSWRRGAARAR